jgi:tetratricopeptide (TPR) repeat protein
MPTLHQKDIESKQKLDFLESPSKEMCYEEKVPSADVCEAPLNEMESYDDEKGKAISSNKEKVEAEQELIEAENLHKPVQLDLSNPSAMPDKNESINVSMHDAESYSFFATDLTDETFDIHSDESSRERDKKIFREVYAENAFAKHTVQEDFKSALINWTEAIKRYPEDPQLYRARAVTKHELRDFDSALLDIKEAIKLNPRNAHYYVLSAQIKEELQDFQGALADCNEAIKFEPENADYYATRAKIKLRLQDSKSALEDFNKVMTLIPEDSDLYIDIFLERLKIKATLKDFKSGLQDVKKRLEYIDFYSSLIYFIFWMVDLKLGKNLVEKRKQANLLFLQKHIPLILNQRLFAISLK